MSAMRRTGHTRRSHARGLRALHVFTGREGAGSANPPVAVQLILRWSARASSLLVLGLLLASLFGTDLNLKQLGRLEALLLLCLLTLCAGLAMAWRWEGWGGSIALIAMGSFFLLEWSVSGSWPGGWTFPALAVPGVLFVASRLCSARTRHSRSPVAED